MKALNVLLQAISVVLWGIAASGWLLAHPLPIPLAGQIVLGFAIALAASLVHPDPRPNAPKSALFGPTLAAIAIAAQWALGTAAYGPLLVLTAASALLMPVASMPRDRLHLGAAALSLAIAPQLAGPFELWGFRENLPAPDLVAALALGAAWFVWNWRLEKHLRHLPRQKDSALDAGATANAALTSTISSASASTDSNAGTRAGSSWNLPSVRQSPASASAITSGIRTSPAAGRPEDDHSSNESEFDPTSTQYFNKVYLQRQEEQARAELQGLLEPVVLFMSRNFRAYSALGFLMNRATGQLELNSSITRSQHVKPQATVLPGEGLLGAVIDRPRGFITGDVSAYGKPPEYYGPDERVSSVMAIRVMNETTRELQALLVVDNQAPRAFNDEHLELLSRFAKIASALVTVAQTRETMAKQAKWADTLYDIQFRLSQHLNGADILTVLGDTLRNIFEYRRMTVCTWNGAKRMAQVARIVGEAEGLQTGALFAVHDSSSLYGRVFRERKELAAHGLRNENGMLLFDGALDATTAWRPEDILITPLLNDRQECIAVLGLESDAPGAYSETELKLLSTISVSASIALTRAAMYSTMEKLATIDGLTQVPNHRRFQDLLSKEIERIQRYGGCVGLLLFDIDHFKGFNDTYGHPIGDLVLKEVARCVQGTIRTTDILARYGGEEFVVLLLETERETILQSAERVRAAIEAMRIPHEDKTLQVTISIGASHFPEQASTKQELIDNADKAMYHSKRSGRNRVSFFSTEMDAEAKEKGPPGH